MGDRRRWRLGAALALVLAGVVVVGGCAGPSTTTELTATTAAAVDASQTSRREVLGTSMQGRPIEVIRLGEGPATILLLATIHGDEDAGTPLMDRLAAALIEEPWRLARRTVLIVPDANPDGRVAQRRGNMAGVDLNRDFPASNRGAARLAALAQPESRLIAELVASARPDLIVSLHQPLSCVDWDGPEPAATIAGRMARACGLPARKLGARNGSLGAWAGETLGIPTITFELPGSAGRDEAADWDRYRDALFIAVQSVNDAAAAGSPAS